MPKVPWKLEKLKRTWVRILDWNKAKENYIKGYRSAKDAKYTILKNNAA